VPAAERAAPVSPAEAASLFADLAHHPRIVLAVSGGPDSTALAVLAARWRGGLSHGPRLHAVTVDHRLRAGSGDEAKAVKRLARKLGIAHCTAAWTGRKPRAGLQEAARTARYALLAAAAHKTGAPCIVTAHTLDDQAETVLFRLARGSGPSGLGGMARVAPVPGCADLVLVRPFLGIAKARLVATLQVAGIAFAEDPSNADPRFTRSRYRRIMPWLAAEGLDAGRLALLARRTRRADAAIEAAVDAALPLVSLTHWSNSRPIILDRAGFAKLPTEVALRLLGRAIATTGDEGRVELAKLEALFDGVAGHWQEAREGCLRRTLAGAVVTAAPDRLEVQRAPPRRQRLSRT